MADRSISILGAQYTDVPAVELPETGGGTATFTEISDTTATAGDVLSGAVFYTASGVRTTGSLGSDFVTSSPGGIKIYISSSTPSGASEGDLWIDTSSL